MPLHDGQTIAGYTIVRLLGVGGMGEVYLAQHPRLPRRDALKILPIEVSSDNEYRLRFEQEADGMEYWIIPVTAAYTGDATGTRWVDITVNFVGSDNRTYDRRCGVIPDALNDVGKLYKGGVAKGNTCVAIPAGAEGLWSASTGFIGKPVFFG